MKELLLHIGMHKTGSSSIQSSLKDYADDRTHYASFQEENHSKPVTTLFSSDPYNLLPWKRRGLSKRKVDSKKKHYLKILEGDILNPKYRRLLISGETIGTISNDAKTEMVDFFRARDCDIKVVCFLRAPDDYVKSMLQQQIKGGLKELKYINPYYKLRLKKFTNLLPSENFIVRDFSKISKEHGDIVRGFVSLCELDETRVDFIRINETLSATATQLLYKLNKLLIAVYGTEERYRAAIKFRKALIKAFPATRSDKLNGAILSGLLKPGLDNELAFISKKFDIDYDVNVHKSGLAKCEAYLSDLSGVDIGKIAEMLSQHEVPISQNATIDQMLIALHKRCIQEATE